MQQTHHPRATILFLAYNQQDFVTQAAQSCLDQQCEPLEIILSDDCSEDCTFERLQQLAKSYAGPHRVLVRQNPHNLGIADHYNTLIGLASGDLLITAAGDDISSLHRAQALLEAWDASNGKLDLIASYAKSIALNGQDSGKIIQVDQLSHWTNAAQWCKKRPYVVGATHAFTKRIWAQFGSLASDIPYEDQIITLRALCMGGGLTLETPLISYRAGGVSAKKTTSDKASRLDAIAKRYARQLAVFNQVRLDLDRAGLASLWTGKVKRYWTRSHAALSLLRMRQQKQKIHALALWKMVRQCGPLWTLRQFFYTWQ
jgi:glycosyltransferase involved in cell wall biosynthesis